MVGVADLLGVTLPCDGVSELEKSAIRGKIFSPDRVVNQEGVVVRAGTRHVADQVLGDFRHHVSLTGAIKGVVGVMLTLEALSSYTYGRHDECFPREHLTDGQST
jgi:hypothetical protein